MNLSKFLLLRRIGALGGGGASLLLRDQSIADRASMAGLDQPIWSPSSFVGGGASAAGRTVVSYHIENRVRQDGYIRRFVASVNQVGAANGWKFKLFRPNGATYDFVGETETFTPAGTGVQTFNPATPILAQMEDVIGVWMVGGSGVNQAIINVQSAAQGLRYTAGDISDSNEFTSLLASTILLDGLGVPPYVAIAGDSIAEGHNTDVNWHTRYHIGSGYAGNPTAEIGNQLRGLFGETLEYQTHARNSQTFAWVAATGMPAAVASNALGIIVHCGVNDVATGRTWAAVEADLDTIVALLGVGQHLFVGEILPWTSGTNAQAITIRTWNGELATWCAANGATLILCHDEMGQIRVATGELDDLKTEYDQSGLHLTQAGVDAMAAIWKTALLEHYA